MKAHTHYNTPISATPWMRRIVLGLATSLALLATIIGLIYALGFSVSTTRPTADRAVRIPSQRLIANCRLCRDEALAAQVKAAAQPDRVVPAVHTTISGLIANCRACRDDALGANQARLPAAGGGTVFSQLDDPRRPGPR
jgi:hypothetical protein